MSNKPLNEQLRDKRVALQMSLREAARHLPVKHQFISRYERGLQENEIFAQEYKQFLEDCESEKVSYKKGSWGMHETQISDTHIPCQLDEFATDEKSSKTWLKSIWDKVMNALFGDEQSD